MTTIVATRKALYADTLCSYTVPFKVNKITRIGKSLFAGTGDMDDLQRFFNWRRDGGDPPVLGSDTDILEVCADGIFIWGGKLVRLLIDEEVYAVGSGCQYAMGALAMGATPTQAIKVTAGLDPSTGKQVHVVKLRAR